MPNRFFLGHPRVKAWPEAEIVKEVKHAKGSFISIVEHNEVYWICQRETKHHAHAEVMDYVEEAIYQWEGTESLEQAHEWLQIVLDDVDHYYVLRAYKRRRPRDAQREKVYTWENRLYREFGLDDEMAQEEVIEFIDYLDQVYPYARPTTLTFNNRRHCSFSGLTTINIAHYGRNRGTVLHEFAHKLAGSIHGRLDIQAHGKEFVGVLMKLLHEQGNIPLFDMTVSAKRDRVKFVSPSLSIPKDAKTYPQKRQSKAA